MNSNSIQELADLDPLAGCKGLTHLVLMDNPVTRKEVCVILGYTFVLWCGAVREGKGGKASDEMQYWRRREYMTHSKGINYADNCPHAHRTTDTTSSGAARQSASSTISE